MQKVRKGVKMAKSSYNKKYNKKYYKKNKERLKEYARSRYKHKNSGKCKICGADITHLESRRFVYCAKCTKTKVSRQARWYRKNRKKIKKKRGAKC